MMIFAFMFAKSASAQCAAARHARLEFFESSLEGQIPRVPELVRKTDGDSQSSSLHVTVRAMPVSQRDIYDIRTKAPGPGGKLPLTPEMLIERPSGDIFGLTQNAGMGWNPSELGRKQFLILSTQGGMRAPNGEPIALGYHTGHWEIALQVQAAAEELRRLKTLPFAAYCSDPCDGRTQGTVGMFDSLPYRNDAAILFRRLARSLPTRSGVMGVATCDKGLPAMMMALAGLS